MSQVVGYYQTFVGLKNMTNYTHVHVASLHFGVTPDNQPYIHLNNLSPNHPSFDKVWEELADFNRSGGTVVLMIGGAGGGYQTLFDKYQDCNILLKNLLINKQNIIDGIDFNVEEPATIDNLTRLAGDLCSDFSHLFFTAAPLSSSLAQDIPGMGGFIYNDLEIAFVKHNITIDYYNWQFYGVYTVNEYNRVVANGYRPDRIIMGQLAPQDLNAIIPVIKQLYDQYGRDFGGVFTWEYNNAAPMPDVWASTMALCLKGDKK